MFVPTLLLLASLAGILAALGLPGLSDLLMLAGPCAIASLFLLLRYRPPPVDHWPQAGPVAKRAKGRFADHPHRSRLFERQKPHYIVIDGSNVLYWKDNTPQLETLREVVQQVAAMGYAPGVVFDANAGYKITGAYQHDKSLGKLLGLPQDRVMVVPSGTPADPMVLDAARDLNAQIVTNDRYRDWAASHPEIQTPGHLIKGGYRDGKLWLDLRPAPALH